MRAATFLFVCLCYACSNSARADTKPFAIIHPELETASGSVFKQILVGIARFQDATIVANSMGETADLDALQKWSVQQNPAAVILLGSQGSKIAGALQTEAPKYIVGTVRPPAGFDGVSMLGEPAQFFTQLKQLAPNIRTVSIIYSPDANDWWIKPAATDANKAGLKLKSLVANDVVSSARIYRDFLAGADSKTDALWIPLTDIAPMKTVLPLILRESWSRNIVVFAHNPLLVKQGVLFALYPDNEAMGYQVAELASRQSKTSNPATATNPTHAGSTVEHAKKLYTAVNRRTAAHLGLTISEQQMQLFDRVYPVQ